MNRVWPGSRGPGWEESGPWRGQPAMDWSPNCMSERPGSPGQIMGLDVWGRPGDFGGRAGGVRTLNMVRAYRCWRVGQNWGINMLTPIYPSLTSSESMMSRVSVNLSESPLTPGKTGKGAGKLWWSWRCWNRVGLGSHNVNMSDTIICRLKEV